MCFFFESLIIPNCSAGFRPYEIILFYFEHFVFCFYPWGFEPGTQFQGIQEYGFIKERHSKKYVEPLMLGTAPPIILIIFRVQFLMSLYLLRAPDLILYS